MPYGQVHALGDKGIDELEDGFAVAGRAIAVGISAELSHKDLRYFEFLLRGRHITGEADYAVELVAVK